MRNYHMDIILPVFSMSDRIKLDNNYLMKENNLTAIENMLVFSSMIK